MRNHGVLESYRAFLRGWPEPRGFPACRKFPHGLSIFLSCGTYCDSYVKSFYLPYKYRHELVPLHAENRSWSDIIGVNNMALRRSVERAFNRRNEHLLYYHRSPRS